MDNYLILSFKNARLFRNQDYVFDMYGTRKDENGKMFEEPITVYQISNVIHTLFGERPVPTKREVLFKRNQYFFDKANESFLKIDSYQKYNEKHKRYDFIKEFMQTKKAVYNSHRIASAYWQRIERYLGEEHYKYFLIQLKDIFDISPSTMSFEELKIFLNQHKDNSKLMSVFEYFGSQQKSGLFNYIYKNWNQINESTAIRLTVISGVARPTKLSGEILIPVTDDDLKLLQKSKGCATILDGGLVSIKRVQSANTLNIANFKKVNQISLNQICYEN